MMNDELEQVVISGAGLITALGLTRTETWRGIKAGKTAFGKLSTIESQVPGGAEGAEAAELAAEDRAIEPREVRYLRRAIRDALADAGFGERLGYEPSRCACVLGTTLHGMRSAGRFLRTGSFECLETFLAGNTLQLALEGLAIGGAAATNCSACSSSLASVALGATMLQNGRADLVIAGGYDALGEYVFGGFNTLRLIDPGVIRPFSKLRAGMKLAEGYGIVILERARDAASRRAKPLARVLAWGETADAHHLTQPDPEGNGAARAIEEALARGGVAADGIDLISAHATGTKDNDAGEYAALKKVFQEKLGSIPVVGFKSHLGHTLGAAGSVELILSAMALQEQLVPACANVQQEEIEFDGLKVAVGAARAGRIRATLNTSLGFGGSNACVILGAPDRERPTSAVRKEGRAGDEPCISGIGIVLPGIGDNDAFVRRLDSDGEPAWGADVGPIPQEQLQGLVNARRVRRMSEYVKTTLAATSLAVRDAGIDDFSPLAEASGALIGTTHGSCNYCVAYYEQIVREGIGAANPILFAEGVPNSGAAQLSLMLSLKRSCQAIIGTRTAGIDALAFAADRIRTGQCARIIVSAAEESHDIVRDAHRHCGQAAAAGGAPFVFQSGFVMSPAGVTFIIESRREVERRGGRARARIAAVSQAYGPRALASRSVARVMEQLGEPGNVISSACGSWIDRAEAVGLRQAGRKRVVSSIYGHVGETFSAGALLGIAAVVLSKKLPRLRGGGLKEDGLLRPSDGVTPTKEFAVVCTDFAGGVSGVGVALL